MDSPPERYTLLLVPEDGQGEVKQLGFSARTLRRWTLAAGVAVGLVICFGLMGVFSVLRLVEHQQLVEENLHLRGQLHDIEGKLHQVDAALRRVQLYDSQLRKAMDEGGIRGGFGPLDDEEAELIGLSEDPGWPDVEGVDGQPMDDHGEDLTPADLRPAEAWASAVATRTDDFLRRLSRAEPELGLLAEDMADLLSVSMAFPSIWPVQGEGVTLTSGFGYRRSPINNRRKFHNGVDLSAARGTRVFAAASGVVIASGYNSGYGRQISIDHGYGVETRYAHNSSLFVKEGDWVEAGQVIATVGSTGQATGPHLHFELRVDGEFVDPLEYLPR
ncbi:MAG: M23 family metallopeptidase [Alphaproteobacteria bacterium]|nr:M23 family metallopeptidase [Alphaproteobacteria bacterium]MCB9792564.1 M23 family metallopeptidase [Alphaproteobacteria bacterium]